MASDARERAAEESLQPPGVETETISADEVMVDQGSTAGETIEPPGTEANLDSNLDLDSAEPKIPTADKDSEDASEVKEEETGDKN